MVVSASHPPLQLRAVQFDLAGTLIDFGCMAPLEAFSRAFDAFGIVPSAAQIRAPMGRAKHDHIAQMLALPEIRDAWTARHGQVPGTAEIDGLYAAFLDADAQVATDHCALVPGAHQAVAALIGRGLMIGATTGYPREIVDRLMPLISAQGLTVATPVTASDVACGRPAPDMCLLAAQRLGVADPAACVVVDDSQVGIEAARAGGMWAIAVAASGNEIGMPFAQWTALSPDERERRLVPVRETMRAAGAHLVIDTVADIELAVDVIGDRLAAGKRP